MPASLPHCEWYRRRSTCGGPARLSPGQSMIVLREHELRLLRRQRPPYEIDGIRFAKREWRIAAEQQILRRNDASGKAEIVGLETNRVEIEVAKVITNLARQRARERGVGIDLALHTIAQHQAERAGMRADELHTWMAVEKIAADHAEDIDCGVEKITGHHRQLILAGAVSPGRVGGMQKQRHIELLGGVENRPKALVRQIDPAHVGADMAADERVLAHAAAQLRGRRSGSLHGQE